MEAKIETQYVTGQDKVERITYTKTSTRAVYGDDGKRLDRTLTDMQASIDLLSGGDGGALEAIQQDIQDLQTGKADIGHNHDAAYHTKAEITNFLAGKSDAGHAHSDLYNTKVEVTNLLAGKAAASHDHNTSYNTKAEITTLLSAKANSSHTHDDRYYTEAETNNLLAAKANSSHSQAASTITAGTFGGAVAVPAGTDYAAAKLRNVKFATTAPTSLSNGEICLVYTP